MELDERLEHFEKHQLEQDDEYGAEVLRNARERIAQLEDDLADSSAQIIMDADTIQVLKAENERLQSLGKELWHELTFTIGDNIYHADDDEMVAWYEALGGE